MGCLRNQGSVDAFLSYENGNYPQILKGIAEQCLKGIWEGSYDKIEVQTRFVFVKEFLEVLRIMLLNDADSVEELMPGID
jgi:hypothetical protein